MIKNRIQQVISSKSSNGFRFKATNEYYHTIGIGKKTFGEFIRNDKQPDLTQIESIAKSLGVAPIELIEGNLNEVLVN
jgi:hypothetical protein